MPEQRKKRRLWEVDASIFQPGEKASFFERRIIPTLKQLGGYGLLVLAISYPILLVIVGIAFGGLVFWSVMAGSIVAIAVVIEKLGYASNFRNWDVSFRKMGAVVLGFMIAFSFYAGLFNLKLWLVPIAVTLLSLGLIFALRRSRA